MPDPTGWGEAQPDAAAHRQRFYTISGPPMLPKWRWTLPNCLDSTAWAQLHLQLEDLDPTRVEGCLCTGWRGNFIVVRRIMLLSRKGRGSHNGAATGGL